MRAVNFLPLITIIGLTLSGCVTHHPVSTAEPWVSMDYSPEYSAVLSSKTSVTVSQARVYQDGDEFVVSGKVKRMHEIQLPGHVDLAICDSDGTLLIQKTTRIPSLASNRKGVLELPFRFRLGFVPPEGSKIRLQYHPPASANTGLSCLNS